MEGYRKEYERWLSSPAVDEATKQELRAVEGNEEEIKGRFSAPLEFGTGGLRGGLGAGIARMNLYTVRQATQGLANLVLSHGAEAAARGVVVAHDSRHRSREFAEGVCGVLAASGVRAYLFDELRPTPELSFAVRELHCIAGVNITASHNPKQYNGYKVYWEDGGQLPPTQADTVLAEIRKTDILNGVRFLSFEQAHQKGLVTFVGRELDEKYLSNVLAQSISGDAVRRHANDLAIVYTPFHGAGYRLVPEVLRRLGFERILPVPEQMVIDGDFPTVKSPNPEDKEGFALAIEMARREGSDLIIGTDPDSDRCGIVVRAGSDYITLSGNQVGVLLADYIIRTRAEKGTMPQNPVIVTTIVSSRMVFSVAAAHNIPVLEVLTGFKFIGEKIHEFEETNEYSFLFGFEESYGYLSGTYARDKDAVVASMLICEMAAWYKDRGMTLYDAMQALYKEYGFYGERTESVNMSGFDAFSRMQATMKRLRGEANTEIGGTAVTALRDYLSGERVELATGAKSKTGLPTSDVLFYELADGCYVVVRPSGTEPKVKLYVLCRGDSEAQVEERLTHYAEAFRALMGCLEYG